MGETETLLPLKGLDEYHDIASVTEKIMQTNAHKTESEKLQREVGMLNEIQRWKLEISENKKYCSNKFEKKVYNYTHQKNAR